MRNPCLRKEKEKKNGKVYHVNPLEPGVLDLKGFSI